jgi:AraC-like DNA-binding protein
MAANKGIEYWEEKYPYVKEHMGTLSIQQMADALGCTKRTLCRQIKKWRAEKRLDKGLSVGRPKVPKEEKNRTPKTDWEQYIPYLQENSSKYTITQMAANLGINRNTLAWHIMLWKEQGKISLSRKRQPHRDLIEKKCNGIVYIYKWSKSGKYVSLGRKDGQPPPKKPGPPSRTVSSKLLDSIAKRREEGIIRPVKPPKPKVEQMKTKVVDEASLRSVRINRSTVIRVPADVTDAEAIQRYNEKYNK